MQYQGSEIRIGRPKAYIDEQGTVVRDGKEDSQDIGTSGPGIQDFLMAGVTSSAYPIFGPTSIL